MPVPEALRPWVSGTVVTSYGGADSARPLIHEPDATSDFVWRATRDGHTSVLVMGPRTHASYHVGKDIPVCARFRVRLGAAPALSGVPTDQLTDRVVPLAELWGRRGEQLDEELAAVRADPGLAVERMHAALLSRAAGAYGRRAPAHLTRTAAAALSRGRDRPPARVRDVAQQAGVSERQFRNVFTAVAGVPPKQYARISRVRTVLRGARETSWALLAADAGYYDQSHMTAEFHRVMRVTPRAFASGQLPAVRC